MVETVFEKCPVCGESNFAEDGNVYRCPSCELVLKSKKRLFGLLAGEQYVVRGISSAYGLAKKGLVGHVFSRDDVARLAERVYSDEQLAAFSAGNFDDLVMPSSLLAQILLKQLKETCYIEMPGMRRGTGPAIEAGGSHLPQGRIAAGRIAWQDRGNLFLTDSRLVFPSNTFTFIRMDRKLVGLKTFENGIALQRKGQDTATYFFGCRPYQAALLGAYIQGRVAGLRESLPVES